jgi:hypothetical protein
MSHWKLLQTSGIGRKVIATGAAESRKDGRRSSSAVNAVRIHTLHQKRSNAGVPSPSEVEVLPLFGRRTSKPPDLERMSRHGCCRAGMVISHSSLVTAREETLHRASRVLQSASVVLLFVSRCKKGERAQPALVVIHHLEYGDAHRAQRFALVLR